MMGGKKEIYRDVRFFHGALQLEKVIVHNIESHTTRVYGRHWQFTRELQVIIAGYLVPIIQPCVIQSHILF